MTSKNAEAVAAFTEAKAEIDEMLARIAAFSADHFGTSPEEIHWGHASALNHYAIILKRITDSAFSEGENA